MNDRGRVAVIFGCRHDAVFAAAGVEDRDSDHQRDGEIPATGVSDRKALRHRSGSCLGGGDHPRATGARCARPRAAIIEQAKPKRPHARVADPSRVDGVRPGVGPRISANGSGVVYGFESGQLGNGPRADANVEFWRRSQPHCVSSGCRERGVRGPLCAHSCHSWQKSPFSMADVTPADAHDHTG